MASSGPGMAAGGLDPSRNGEGFGPTPTACSETSGGVSAPALECPRVYVHVLGNDVTGQPRYKCYGKLEASVLGKNKNAVKKASDNCIEGRQETEHAFIYDPTGVLPGPYRAHMGILIDNRKDVPVRIIEESDRSSVDKSRHVLDSFFTAKTFISQVYEMRPAAAEPGPKRRLRKKGISRFQSMGLWKSALPQ